MTASDDYSDPGYTQLPACYKNKFKFRLATTSFIYPDHILPNVRMLKPHLDEIELLFFESRPDSLPPDGDMDVLKEFGDKGDISYNIHLPTDTDPCHPDPKSRKKAIGNLFDVLKLTRPLDPTTYTLHLPCTENPDDDQSAVRQWRQRACDSLETLLSGGIPPERISVETLSYPPQWLKPILDTFNLSMCLDVGHLIEHGRDPASVFDAFAERITIIHLYGGVEKGRGHLPLNRLPETHAKDIRRILGDFEGTVSIEVFSYSHLRTSIEYLEQLLQQKPD